MLQALKLDGQTPPAPRNRESEGGSTGLDAGFAAFLAQAAFTGLARLFGLGFWWQVLLSTVFFALPHFLIAASSGLFAGLFFGVHLGILYAALRQRSWGTAVLGTTALHALNNLLACSMLLLSRALGVE